MEEDDRKLSEWLQVQKELLEEKNILTNILSQIDKQIHALQVEKLHLLSTINAKSKASNDSTSVNQVISLPSTSRNEIVEQKPLELSVPILMDFVEEEENEEENSFDELDEHWQ